MCIRIHDAALHAATPNATLHFDGLGLTDAAANMGLRCGVALTIGELAGVIAGSLDSIHRHTHMHMHMHIRMYADGLDSHAVHTHPYMRAYITSMHTYACMHVYIHAGA